MRRCASRLFRISRSWPVWDAYQKKKKKRARKQAPCSRNQTSSLTHLPEHPLGGSGTFAAQAAAARAQARNGPRERLFRPLVQKPPDAQCAEAKDSHTCHVWPTCHTRLCAYISRCDFSERQQSHTFSPCITRLFSSPHISPQFLRAARV